MRNALGGNFLHYLCKSAMIGLVLKITKVDLKTMDSLLKIISTPIGNLGDISERCRETLEKETYFLAEDTREFFKLLDLLEIPRAEKSVEY